MLGKIARLLNSDPTADSRNERERIEVATCALLLEMAYADKSLHELEERVVRDIVASKFELSAESVSELVEYAQQARDESVDLFRFARVINENFSIEEKHEVMEALWRIVYADGVLDKHEDALARQLTSLLRISPKKSIELKLKVLEEIDPDR
ncbi:MAG: hypothetical protein C0623_11175 [Desulfuromonas sp.]|nr:MAG: hypothetical protein C0623_11175 [Desulfuromonas sp.]